MREPAELERLRRAVARLMDAQQEALDATDQAVESGGVGLGDDAQLLEATERLEAVLVDVRDILQGASEDVREILGDGA